MKTLAPYGTWESPVTVENITDTGNSLGLVDILVDSVTSKIYHIETRPAEGGRDALLLTESGRDITGPEWDVKSKVNGYGGAPAIVHDGVCYFCHAADGRIYKVNVEVPNNGPEAITPGNSFHKFANYDVYPLDRNVLVCVFEDATAAKSPSEVVNSLCFLDVSTKQVFPLESDASFYSSPKFSPDGKRLVWVEWDLPDMPWNGTEIWIADVVAAPGSSSPLVLKNRRHVAGEHSRISVAYPSWLSNDSLIFTSDISGFENPWTYDCTAGVAKAVFETPMEESFGCTNPPKKLGWSPYAVIDVQSTVAVFTAIKDGRSVLCRVDLAAGTAVLLPSPYVEISHIRPLRSDQFVFIGTTTDAAPALVQCTLPATSDAVFLELQSAAQGSTLPRDDVSLPRPLKLLVPHELGTRLVHVIYYPPTNSRFAGLDGEKPPCVLNVHGGPVGISPQSFNATKQFFTTRGWAWLDVNHRGTSGYGRVYMELLRESWGVVDVEDSIDAARILSAPPHDLIDPKRVVIRGQSAGGFTTLSALSVWADNSVFAAGTSLYGVSDCERLQKESHKFESGYFEMLFGRDPQVARDRSPIFHAEKIVAPLLILQGAADTAVPPSQAEIMVESIRKRGGVVEYQLYAGEGHGWKRKDTIEDALRREIQFYSRVLGIECKGV
ncbi:Alpha/Beta hydrolase protein [Mycena metata]|uniref:Alpha/Beta hydrolase protein n=1 Tax=Mycena metata TaxID=1033252 RepID=A0AAD7JHE1_9AGAR|nr:Alpha/Beta hydrolase protein [Mycena metata]